MLEKSFGLLFRLRKKDLQSKEPLTIYLRITVDGNRKEVSTKLECEPDKWNSYAQRVKGTSEDVRSINASLDSIRVRVTEIRKQLFDNGKPITAESLLNGVLGITDKPRMILEIFQTHNDQMATLINKEFSPATLERYKTSLEHTRSFIKWKYNVSDLEISKLDYEFVSEYEYWLKSIRSCNHNTAIKYISNFRKIVNRCIRNGWLLKDPFVGFKMTKREVIRTALTGDELEVLSNKIIDIPRLSQVRDIFLFACLTGLAYADIEKLTWGEIQKGIDDEQWIFTNRQKTETSSRIPLLPTTIDILNRYKGECVSTTDKVLPVFTNQIMNSYLKEIGAICGINKNLTFHLARHTFATTVTLSNGVPIESVSKMLGHKNIRTTQLYAKVLDRKVSDDMKLLREKYKKAV